MWRQRVSFLTIFKEVVDDDGAMAKSSANAPLGTGFVSRYRLPPRAGF